HVSRLIALTDPSRRRDKIARVGAEQLVRDGQAEHPGVWQLMISLSLVDYRTQIRLSRHLKKEKTRSLVNPHSIGPIEQVAEVRRKPEGQCRARLNSRGGADLRNQIMAAAIVKVNQGHVAQRLSQLGCSPELGAVADQNMFRAHAKHD